MANRSLLLLIPILLITVIQPTLSIGETLDTAEREGGLWPIYGRSPSRNWRTPITLLSDCERITAWSYQTGTSISPHLVTDYEGKTYFASTAGTLYCVSGNGELVWSYKGGNRSDDTCPAIGPDGTIYYTTQTDVLHALAPNGTLLWKRAYKGTVASSSPPIITPDGRIYLGQGSHSLLCLNMNGSVNWTAKVKGCIYTAPLIGHDGNVNVNTASGNLYSISPAGGVLWERSMGAYSYSSVSLCDDGDLIASNNDGSVFCYSSNGTLLWRTETGAMVHEGLAVSSEGNFFGCFGTSLIAFSPNGTIMWRRNLSGPCNPVIDGSGNILVPDRVLKCYSQGGDLLWSVSAPNARLTGYASIFDQRTIMCCTYSGIIKVHFPLTVTDLKAEQISDTVRVTWNVPEEGDPPYIFEIIRTTDKGTNINYGFTENLWFVDMEPHEGGSEYNIIPYFNGTKHHRSYVWFRYIPGGTYYPIIELNLEAIEGGILIDWSCREEHTSRPVTVGIERVTVARIEDGDEPVAVDIVFGNVNEGFYFDGYLVPGVQYWYFIVITFDNGESLSSRWMYHYIDPPDPPDQPLFSPLLCLVPILVAWVLGISVAVYLYLKRRDRVWKEKKKD